MARRLGIYLMVAALVFALGAGSLVADEGEAEAEGQVVIVTSDGPTPLASFLKTAAKALDIPLVWDPKSRALQNKEITGAVTLEGTPAEILDGLRSLLTYYELVLIPSGEGANRRILVMDARQTAAIVKLKPVYVELNDDNLKDYEDKDGLFLTTTIRVENMENLRDARNALNRIVTGQNIGNVTEVPAARSFVVTDFAPNVVAIYLLLKEMDVPFSGPTLDAGGREIVFQAVRLKAAEAEAVARTLTLMFGANAGPRPQQAARSPQQQTLNVPPTPALRIQPDTRLNQVLLTGMRKDVEQVVEVLRAMDQPKTESKAVIQFLRLEHIDALGAAAAVGNLIRRYPEPWLAETGTQGLPAVEAHPETNGLLIHATEHAATALRRLVAEMDQPTVVEEVIEEGAASEE